MNNNRKTVRCKHCGQEAVITVVPDGFDDAPPTFVITEECRGRCAKSYYPCTAQQMHELTGLSLTGWS